MSLHVRNGLADRGGPRGHLFVRPPLEILRDRLRIDVDSKEERADLVVQIARQLLALFFLHGAGLADPHGLLQGGCTRVRGIVLSPSVRLDDPRVRALIDAALRPHHAAFEAAPRLATAAGVCSTANEPGAAREMSRGRKDKALSGPIH